MTEQSTYQRVLRRRAGGGGDRRGSAIILVLVSMVLMSILAGSLLQVTRFERIPRSESNIEVVIASVVDEILNQLTEDLLDENGRFLNAADLASGGNDEPWDFPWTNPANFGRTAERNDGSTVAVFGGSFDDSWLASHMPDFGAAPAANTAYAGGGTNATDGIWRKITNLTGLYLAGNNLGSSDLSLNATPVEFPVNNYGNVLYRDVNHLTTQDRLVDADGDGIGDSRWEWAPLRRVGATQYVMAVRIVDLSARMDVNVAMGVSNVNYGDRRAFGDSPVELDATGFVGLASVAGGLNTTTTRAEWERVLRYRLMADGSSAYGSIPSYDNNAANPAAGTRQHHWTDGASRVSNTLDRNGIDAAGTFDYRAAFGTKDLFELLQGNGLNSNNNTTLEDLMPTFLRRNAGQENGYAAGSGTPPWSGANGRRNFWELDPRKHITTHSGVSIAARPYADGLSRQLKIDVNEAVKTAAGRNVLRNRILAILNTNNPGWGTTAYPHLGDPAGLADQLTANIADYIDNDNQLTVVNGKTGFEALPYITEIYTQRHYESDNPTNPPEMVWDARGAQGYVIEIGNPFAPDTSGAGRPVSLEDVWINMNGTLTELSPIAGVPAELAPGEVLLLYQNSAGPLGSLDTYHSDNGGSNDNNTPGSFTTVHTAIGPAMDGTATTQTIGLQAATQGAGTPTGWNYNACEIELGGISADAIPTAGYLGGPGIFTYIQTHYVGHGVGLRMMTVTKGGGSNDYTADTTTLTDPSINYDFVDGSAAKRTIASTLANESKTGAPAGFANLANQQIVWPDSDRNRMHWIGDILQIPLIGPDSGAADRTMAGSFVAAAGGTTLTNATLGNGINALLLPYDASTAIGSGTLNYPHTVLLMENLTTFSPATDGKDGDGVATAESITNPNEDEVLVPGKININTAPYDTLVRLLPFPDLPTRERIAQAIINRRESTNQPATYGMGANNIPGVAYTPALFQQIATLTNGATPSGAYTNTSADGNDTVNLGGARIDLNQYETPLGTYPYNPDGIADDREEQIMLAKWLTEMTDTRSDVFAAYIVVQGYPADNFSAGATESARLIVLFSRAGVEGSGDKAVEIGRYRIN